MRKALLVSLLSIGALTVVTGNSPASAVAQPKVTICHRTHAVSNPYVRITVAQSAVSNGNGKHGGNSHDQYSTVLFPGGKPNPNVFNPAVTYTPAPEKKWGDIIASLDVSGNALSGNAALVAGLNNTGIGAQIFAGTGAYAGLCKTMTARDYYEVEVIEGGQNSGDVLADMNEFDSDEFASALSSCGGTFTGCPAATLGSPTAAAPTTTTTVAATTTTVRGATTTTVKGATTTTTIVTRKLKGKLWIDANRDGKKDSSEKILSNYSVTVTAGTGNSSTQTYTVTTDSAGNYEISNIPAGNWVVRPAALPSANYEKVYDTDSNTTSADWVVTASVPATGEATADFATALSAAAVASGATDSLGATEVAVTTTTVAAAESSSGTASLTGDGLPTTGSGDTARIMWLAMVMVLAGTVIVRRSRRRTA